MESGWKWLRIIPRGDRWALLLAVFMLRILLSQVQLEARADDSKGDDLGFLVAKVTLPLFRPMLHNLRSPPWIYAIRQPNLHFTTIRVSDRPSAVNLHLAGARVKMSQNSPLRSALFWEMTQSIMVIIHRRFGKTNWFHLQGSRWDR
jgi:hypothetical protein